VVSQDHYIDILGLSIVYLRLLFVILIALESIPGVGVNSHFQKARLSCFEWCHDFHELSQDPQTERSNYANVWATSLFRLFSDQLAKTDSSIVAHYILELLSFVALREGGGLLNDVVDLSWTALHTVYSGEEFSPDCPPYALTQAVDGLSSKGSSSYVKSLRKVLEATFGESGGKRLPSTSKHTIVCTGLLRHWGLMMPTKTFTKCCVVQIRSLVEDIGCLVRAMDDAVQDGSASLRVNSSTKQCGGFPRMPSLPSLDPTTLSEHFETVAIMIVGAVSVTEPALVARVSAVKYSPYHHIQGLLQVYQRLIHIFCDGYVLFPGRTVQCVFRVTRNMLLATVAQLHRCVEWRNSQPLLMATERKAGAFDAGALVHLQNLLGFAASHVVGIAVSLCEFSVDRDEEGLEFPFKRTTLRQVAEKAERELKGIASLHHLAAPSFRLKAKDVFVHDSCQGSAKGFSTTVSSEVDEDKSGDEKSSASEEQERLGESNQSSDDDEAFGVAGAWGDDDSSGCLDLETSLFTVK
jgi:hypothetical protein